MKTNDPSEDAARISSHLEAIRRALRESITTAARAHPIALTPPQALALQVLVDETRVSENGLSLSELSRRMGLAHSTASGIVARLERMDLVRRSAHPADRRYVRIKLAEPVREWIERELPSTRLHPIEATIAAATSAERASIIRGLATLERLLRLGSSAATASR